MAELKRHHLKSDPRGPLGHEDSTAARCYEETLVPNSISFSPGCVLGFPAGMTAYTCVIDVRKACVLWPWIFHSRTKLRGISRIVSL